MPEISAFQKARAGYVPVLPKIFQENALSELSLAYGQPAEPASDGKILKSLFPKTYGLPKATFCQGKNEATCRRFRVGVLLSGGQAPGGHNVIAGLFDALKKSCPESTLLGFLKGPEGLQNGRYIEIAAEVVDRYRNTGGFDMLGSGRTKIETPEQYAQVLAVAERLCLDGIVIVGGDDSNTNAALLAEKFLAAGKKTCVIGVPKTIDGDLKHGSVEASFGFDSATKLFSDLIGNIARDSASAQKNWHFVKVMGRSASHIALECALQTHPNYCVIAEEVAEKKMTLRQIALDIADVICRRAANGDNFGVVVLPEGVIEFLPEMKILIAELNELLGREKDGFAALSGFYEKKDWLAGRLSAQANETFLTLPEAIAEQFLEDRDPHGNVKVSRIETEKLIVSLVCARLRELKESGEYKGNFLYYTHFLGYEGRSLAPSNFDANYCYALGYNAFALIACGATGYISCVENLTSPPAEWLCGGVPLTTLMHLERRNGKDVPVIKKALVDLGGEPFASFLENRERWARTSEYVYPGAIQYFGPPELCDRITETLLLESTRRGAAGEGK